MSSADSLFKALDAALAYDEQIRQRENRRWWAAMMLARSIDTHESILLGKPVRASELDAWRLVDALRGAPLPPSHTYITVTGDMLDAINEAPIRERL